MDPQSRPDRSADASEENSAVITVKKIHKRIRRGCTSDLLQAWNIGYVRTQIPIQSLTRDVIYRRVFI